MSFSQRQLASFTAQTTRASERMLGVDENSPNLSLAGQPFACGWSKSGVKRLYELEGWRVECDAVAHIRDELGLVYDVDTEFIEIATGDTFAVTEKKPHPMRPGLTRVSFSRRKRA